jgi:hypothetical protein
MNATLTEFLALWGATLGTLSLAWNVWTWTRSRPRVSPTVEVRELAAENEIQYEIRNRGGQPTTIEEIQLLKYQDGLLGWLGVAEHVEYVAAKHPETMPLPALLPPGGVWKGSSPLPHVPRATELDKAALIRARKLFFKIRCSHTSRLLSGKVRKERLLPFM